jgi:hypothetical protein
MAHFAELDGNNVVLQVIVVNNTELLDSDGVEQESLGQAFCANLLGGNWKQTSYNATFRKNYAGIGYSYDTDLDAFIPPRPYPSWGLNTTTCLWESPVPYPAEGKHTWDEEAQNWVAE